eukprot:TRINITY_DN93357_c0_g1_i1.p1 TRINITY_DN93357_c0_g1~~TRINITY_DN93357_c0_g1_i1.p1  ORF type:complete len:221 (-),score=45.27 TRINITY_DN93357_c0_g1_i1:135-758(-)
MARPLTAAYASRRMARHCRLAAAAMAVYAASLVFLDERRPSTSWVQGPFAAAPQKPRRALRQQRFAEDDDSGEFDFSEYEAPEGISVLEAEEEDDAVLRPPEAEVFLMRETGQFECGNCGYVYNPFWGEGDNGPGTKFKDLPNNWRCPECKVSKDEFVPVIEQVAGFAENQDYGLGFNTLTASQKSVIIWGGLASLAIFLLSFYFVE